ncbi:sulfurtransferase [Thiopseudomonas alkaliphila]|uniref:Sulfurtransferase n=1 Tax=Thiopseudomonas alkaliphila TaxID=1697053 RepID=A0A0K1XGW9_9GAMM|nr:sulfurtransferase complex subunit TusD [Thiopseudomonas alkaliphila]AKX60428.1 sulfurtransferase [Thiopseudomonas alkaliphila]
MKFTLMVTGSAQSAGSRRALKFAQALLEAGCELTRVFFYQQGVANASLQLVIPQDEANTAAQWQALVQQYQLDAVVCIAAGLRRGVLDQAEAQRYQIMSHNLAPGFELSGLGQLHEALQSSDRLLSFGEY